MKRDMVCPENTQEEQNILTELIMKVEAAERTQPRCLTNYSLRFEMMKDQGTDH